MGHRCNYVVRERGRCTLYYSHWGALTTVADFFFGPRAADAFLATQEVVDEADGWLDDVFGEGGVAFDKDNKVLVIDGGSIYGEARTLAFRLLQQIWGREGYTVREARGFTDIAAAVGVPLERVEASHIAHAADLDDERDNGHSGHTQTLVIVDGEAFVSGVLAGSVLDLGVAAVPRMRAQLATVEQGTAALATRTLESWESERPTIGTALRDVVVIDSARRVVSSTPDALWRRATRRHLAALWPGYVFDVLTLADALRMHPVDGVEVPPAPPPEKGEAPSLRVQLASIEEMLFGERTDPAKWFASLVASDQLWSSAAADGEATEATETTSWVNPHALVSPGDGRMSNAAGRAIFRWAVQQVVGDEV